MAWHTIHPTLWTFPVKVCWNTWRFCKFNKRSNLVDGIFLCCRILIQAVATEKIGHWHWWGKFYKNCYTKHHKISWKSKCSCLVLVWVEHSCETLWAVFNWIFIKLFTESYGVRVHVLRTGGKWVKPMQDPWPSCLLLDIYLAWEIDTWITCWLILPQERYVCSHAWQCLPLKSSTSLPLV